MPRQHVASLKSHYAIPLLKVKNIYMPYPGWVIAHSKKVIGTLRSDVGNENVKKAIGLITKTTILNVHHALLYISLPSLHDCDVKMPNFKLYRGSTQATNEWSLYKPRKEEKCWQTTCFDD